MKSFRLHFESVTTSSYARTPAFSIEIQCESIKDAALIGQRMKEGSWSFLRAEEVK